MKICPKCQHQNPDEVDICLSCGENISNVPVCSETDIWHNSTISDNNTPFSERNIGKALKTVAVVFAIISIILCILGALIFIKIYLKEADKYLGDEAKYMTSVILCLVGAVFCPLASLPLYGFGTLITTVQSIDRRLKQADADRGETSDVTEP